MIPRRAKEYCSEDIAKIENYEKAVADTAHTWFCHHRDEVKVLPSGMTVIRSVSDLKEAGRYYGCPANELIFLTASEHSSLHGKLLRHTEEAKRKILEARKRQTPPTLGKTFSNEHCRKISEALKGKALTDETRRKMSEARKGKVLSDETKRKISEAAKARLARQCND